MPLYQASINASRRAVRAIVGYTSALNVLSRIKVPPIAWGNLKPVLDCRIARMTQPRAKLKAPGAQEAKPTGLPQSACLTQEAIVSNRFWKAARLDRIGAHRPPET